MGRRLGARRQKANATDSVFVSLVGLSGDKNVTMLQAVLDTIPHRPPFLFLDRIDEVRADGATCTRTFRTDEPFYACLLYTSDAADE